MTNAALSDQVGIIGVGTTAQGKLPGSTSLSLSVEAFQLALRDAGLEKSDVDGLLTFPGTTTAEGSRNFLRLGETLGVNPRFTGSLTQGGASAGNLVQMATLAISAGLATTVACVFGDAAKTGGSRYSGAAGWGDSFGIWGLFGAAANSAMTASRHMALYGTSEAQLGEVAVACRQHASLNEAAVMRDPITLEDHANSRLIVSPLRLLDCCIISDGGYCIIVSSADRLKDGPNPPVTISGMGQAFTTQTLEHPEWWYGPHQATAIRTAYDMAGATPADIDLAQLYDNFTISVLLWLEHAGFCEPGESGPFVEGGRIQLGGDLPVNTAGGNLSNAYSQGWGHIIEAVRQLRGQSGDRQVEGAERALVTGRGMNMNAASALVLSGGN